VFVWAGEAAPGAPAPARPGILRWLADNPFSATLLFLVLATLIGSIISRFVRDRCLKKFEGYPVTLELKDGQVYHGELDVEKSGLEFLYERTTPQEDVQKTSFLIFQPEYNTIHALARYVDRLDEAQLRARRKMAQQAYHPGPLRRFARTLRNFFASIKDAMLEAFKLAMGRMKNIQAAAPVVTSGGKYIDQVGSQTIGTAADISYDPLLEKQIGLRVVLALPEDASAQTECVGTLREYSKDFFLLMDVDYESRWDVPLPQEGSVAFVRGMAAQRTPNGTVVENRTTYDVQLDRVSIAAAEGREAPPVLVTCPAAIESGTKLSFGLSGDAGSVTLTFSTRREADLVVPRTGAFVRHKSEWVEPRKLVGGLRDAVGLLPGTDKVVSILRKGARLMTTDTGPQALPFVKLHGCGNDYIYIDCRERVIEDPAALSRRVSDRHFGIGADGLILILPSERADYRMRMFNADGSEAEMCGNGIRCFAKYLYDRGLIEGDEARIETGAGVLRVRIFAEDGKARRVRVNMGAPRLERADIPMEGAPGQVVDEEIGIEVPHEGNMSFRLTAVSMGNPHVIIYVDDVADYPVEVYGPIIENHRLFPRRTNVEFIQVLGRSEVKMRVWERGSGETLACGTGASATCVAGVLNGKTDRTVVVHVLGGDLELEWAEDGNVYLTGPAEEVFEGIIEV
jgi:diaminopimelate epimerase